MRRCSRLSSLEPEFGEALDRGGYAVGAAAAARTELEARAVEAGLNGDQLVHLVLPLLRQLVLLRQGSAQSDQGRRGVMQAPRSSEQDGLYKPIVLVNGPVGAGKTTLGRALQRFAPGFGLHLAVASIDDAYFPLAERRRRLAGNPFGVMRVPPGSHDIPLLMERLQAWRAGSRLRLPRFDKTLADGQGDRAGESEESADALVLEGWLMGCRALGRDRLAGAMARLEGWNLSQPELEWLPHWDRELEAYAALWQSCDGLWLLKPSHWSLPRRWRFQAEARQRRAGGAWLAPRALAQLVRASLHSLPPPLYQDPLVAGSADQANGGLPLLGITLLDRRRRCQPRQPGQRGEAGLG